eukprot:gene26668-biopygen17115
MVPLLVRAWLMCHNTVLSASWLTQEEDWSA